MLRLIPLINNLCNSQDFLSLLYSSKKLNLFLRRKEWTWSTLQMEGETFGAWAVIYLFIGVEQQNRQHWREGRRGRERIVIEHLLLVGIVLELIICFLLLFNSIKKEEYSHLLMVKLGPSEVNNLLKFYNNSRANHSLSLWPIRLKVHAPGDMKLTFLWINLVICFL